MILEVAPKRAFASALDWPGWSRSGRTPEAALDALVAAAPRYATVARRADLTFPPPESPDDLHIVERVAGTGATEFGVPGVAAESEGTPLTDADLARSLALLEAAWATFDDAAEAAKGRQLATGPRGGGRELEAIHAHVRDAELLYVGRLGARARDRERSRETFVDVLKAVVHGEPIDSPPATRRPWAPRYAVRRAAWHVLDHAWEIEDRLG